MTKFKCFSILAAGLFLIGAARAYEKNILDVSFRSIPDNYETLLKTEPGIWNYNFMPYGQGADVLWSDPAVRREASTGSDAGGKRVTAVAAACNEQGLTILVFGAEPGIADALKNGKALPGSMLEMYFAPGDADNHDLRHWYQFIFDQTNDRNLRDFPWLERNRDFQRITGKLRVESKILDRGYISKIFIPWSLLDGCVPFSDKRDNFWRIGIMRWCSVSQTWGGVVQALTSAGYFRMPDFTPAQKDAIRKNLLLRAWEEYSTALLWPVRETDGLNEEWRLKKDRALPRSYMNLKEEREFMTACLPPLKAECAALGEEIAQYDSLTEPQKDALLVRAKKLRQFSFDVQAAHAQFLRNEFFRKGNDK